MSLYRQFGGNLSKSALHHCSNERDRIYGLASLCSKLARDCGLSIQPDYKKSVAQVYRSFARQYLTTGFFGDIRVIYDAGLWRRLDNSTWRAGDMDVSDIEYLPSWAPEYRPAKLNSDELPWNDAPFNTCFVNAPPQIHDHDSNENALGLLGTFVERVETLMLDMDENMAAEFKGGKLKAGNRATLSSKVGHFSTVITLLGTVRHIGKSLMHNDQLLMHNDQYFTGEDWRAALTRTLLAECSISGISKIMFNVPDPGNEQEMIQVWDRFEQCCLRKDGELRKIFDQGLEAFEQQQQSHGPRFSEDAKDAFDFIIAVIYVLSRCQLIFTTYGLLALVPKATQQYDLIVRIAGTKMPYVIRRLEESDMHVLIGPCYVHGIMHCDTVADHAKLLSIESEAQVIYFL
jgi:hypothetical protein